MKHCVFVLLLAFIFSIGYSQGPAYVFTPDSLTVHVRYLASDELQGRRCGTPGNLAAARYIERIMKAAGLTPAGDAGGYFQNFEFVSSVALGSGNLLSFKGPGIPGGEATLTPDVDFRPFGFSADTSVTGSLVFAGYGISTPDGKYDDYAGLDVTGKIVVVLRFSPDGTDPRGELNRYSSFRNKARLARDKGAAGLLIITGPADEQEDQIVKLSFDQSFASSGLAAATMKRDLVVSLLKEGGYDLKALQDSIKTSRKPVTARFPDVSVSLRTNVAKVHASAVNVAGYLPGRDPVLKDQVVIIGAHFDHLGLGGPGSGSLVPDTTAVHHGADDNASGSAGLLELVRGLSAARSSLKRTVLFLAFNGEELGELGSAYYVGHPFFPLDRTVVMVNLDMIGRLDKRSLTVYGTGTSPAWPPLLAKYNADSAFTLTQIADGFGPSDQAQFYGKDLPVLFFFTGTHNDYHRPSDTWDKINYAGEERIVRYVYNVVGDIAALPERPAFTKAPSSAPMGGGNGRGYSVTLGIVPDFAETKDGMKIGGIRPGGPAEQAGLNAGDIIVKMAGKKVMNIYDYMGILGELKAGDAVEVVVMRDGAPVTVTATMAKRK